MIKKNNITPVIPIDILLEEYVALREQSNTIKKRMSEISTEIKNYAEEFGVKNDSGSFYCENDKYVFGKQAKKSVNFDEDKAIDYFTRKKFNDCLDTKVVINEDAVEERISTGDISYEDLESITTTKVSYAVDVKEKEVVEDTVKETVVPVAASSKPKIRVRGNK